MKHTKASKFLSKISTIHGLNYIGDHKSSVIAKIFWISAIILSFLGCFFYFLQVYDKVFVAPDISIKISYKPYNDFPFPTVTVCPQNKFPHTVLNYKQNLKKLEESQSLTEDEKLNMELAFHGCFVGSIDAVDTKFNLSELNLVDELSSQQYQIDGIIEGHCWDGCFRSINDTYHRVLTFDGFCASFNLLDHPELFSDEIHEDFEHYNHGKSSNWDQVMKNPRDFYPRKIPTGYHNNLATFLRKHTHPVDIDCSFSKRGYLVYFHPSNEILTPWHPSVRIDNVNKTNFLELKIRSYKMTPELKGYKAEHRMCYFKNERQLKLFKIYTENNCMFECLTNRTLEQCGCVRHYMPRDNTTRLCRSIDLVCTDDVEVDFEQTLYEDGCKCYPECDRVTYELNKMEINDLYPEEIDYFFEHLRTIDDENEENESDNQRIVDDVSNDIDYKDYEYKSKRIKSSKPKNRPQITETIVAVQKDKVEERISYASYQMQQFISDFGGLLSLAMGCSILSIVELIYNALCFKVQENSEEEENQEDLEVKVSGKVD